MAEGLAAMVSRVADPPRASGEGKDAEDNDDDDDLKFKLPDGVRDRERQKGGGFLDSAAGLKKQEREARIAAIRAKEDGWRVRVALL